MHQQFLWGGLGKNGVLWPNDLRYCTASTPYDRKSTSHCFEKHKSELFFPNLHSEGFTVSARQTQDIALSVKLRQVCVVRSANELDWEVTRVLQCDVPQSLSLSFRPYPK